MKDDIKWRTDLLHVTQQINLCQNQDWRSSFVSSCAAVLYPAAGLHAGNRAHQHGPQRVPLHGLWDLRLAGLCTPLYINTENFQVGLPGMSAWGQASESYCNAVITMFMLPLQKKIKVRRKVRMQYNYNPENFGFPNYFRVSNLCLWIHLGFRQ